MIEHKPEEPNSNYQLPVSSSVSVVGLAIIGYLLYNKFRKPEQNLINVPRPANVSHAHTKIELKRDIFKMYLKCLSQIYIHTWLLKIKQRI